MVVMMVVVKVVMRELCDKILNTPSVIYSSLSKDHTKGYWPTKWAFKLFLLVKFFIQNAINSRKNLYECLMSFVQNLQKKMTCRRLIVSH